MHSHALFKASFALLLGAAALPPGPSTAAAGAPALPSSHREAPFITEHPKVDATDFYLFRSYEPGREGFAIVPHVTRARDLADEAEVKAVYYPEAERLVKQATGASRVLVFDHTIRSAPLAGTGRKGIREPVKRVHNDYTVTSGPQRVRDLLPDEAEDLLKHRFAIVNVWRPLRRTVEDTPLGLLDARSIAPQDLIATDLVYPDRVGETYAVAHNPAHRWFYYPRQRADEAVLLKCYDSKEDGRARFPAHSAFDDPTAPANAPPRESIELRTLAFFPPDA